MSHRKSRRFLSIINLFSLILCVTYAHGQDSLSNPEVQRNAQEADRIKQINEINREIRKSNPVVPEKKKVASKNSDPRTRVPDAGDKPIGAPKSEKPVAEMKPAIPPARTGGYIKNAKGPESMIPGPHIKVTTDDTPEELVFPGTNE